MDVVNEKALIRKEALKRRALLSKEEVEGAAFGWRPYREEAAKYDPAVLKDGWNEVDGEKIYYISNPALGLWSV